MSKLTGPFSFSFAPFAHPLRKDRTSAIATHILVAFLAVAMTLFGGRPPRTDGAPKEALARPAHVGRGHAPGGRS